MSLTKILKKNRPIDRTKYYWKNAANCGTEEVKNFIYDGFEVSQISHVKDDASCY